MHQDFLPPGIVVLTGAGISKESGIDTFRDKDGLWTRVNLEEVATIDAWHRDKKKVLDFYNDTRKSFQAAHIRPYSACGDHRLDNGLLLRSDLHTLFDRG